MATNQVTDVTADQIKNHGLFDLQAEGKDYLTTGVADPFVTGLVVFVVGTGLNGIGNMISYLKKTKTGKKALSDTFKESGKMGIATVIGITAGNTIAATGMVFMAPSVLPISAGVAATYLVKRFWDNTTSVKNMPLDPDPELGKSPWSKASFRLDKKVLKILQGGQSGQYSA
jgi:hypothetical protein